MLMKKQANHFYKILVYVLIFSFGFVFSRFIKNIPYIEISHSVDIANIFWILSTIFLGLIITNYFQKNVNDFRTEKDLIIKRVSETSEMVSTLQKIVITGTISLTEAVSSVKRINKSLISIEKIGKLCEITINNSVIININTNLAELRKTLTDTPNISQSQSIIDLSIKVKDGIIYYSPERVSQIEVKFDNLKDLMLELQIDLNRK